MSTELRDEILLLCKEAGTTIAELFSDESGDAEKSHQSAGPRKYLCQGCEIDGRAARGMLEFESVIVDGKIDDRRALRAGMINPAWLTSGTAAAKQFIRDHEIKVDQFVNG